MPTVFVTFPFISRELIPVLEAEGSDEEEAAALWEQVDGPFSGRSHSLISNGHYCMELCSVRQEQWESLERYLYFPDI